ncbi:hypothetical protein [Botrimarina colliarenosi]
MTPTRRSPKCGRCFVGWSV